MGGVSPSGGAESAADPHVSADEVGADADAVARSKWPGRIGLGIGASVAVVVVVTTVIVASGPGPDATLEQTGADASLEVLQIVNREPYFEVEGSSLRAHQSFEGWDVFSGSNAYGSPCLVVISQDAEWSRIECTPAPAELIADTFPASQSDSRMIRFILDGDTVDARVYPHAGAER
jgi:hypothetical protein